MNISGASQYAINSNFGQIDFGGAEKSMKANEENKTNFDLSESSLSLSSQGKAMSMIDSLNKQKTDLLESKNELIAQTIAGDGDLSSIEKQLEMYDERLLAIEDEIAKTIKEESEKETDNKDKELKTYTKDGTTTGESLSNKLTSLASATQDVKLAESTQAIKKDMEAEARILERQAQGDHGKVRENKLAQANELKTNSEDLSADVADTLKSVNEETEATNI
ncbi:MAG: hypothetical protein ATN35_09550 [Epulopiscium sp. Nele67-Bin004]|nr:MAG: hypothetical protein ATN35_09550 [Epulopiscium sp. Nele67-Bin004]